MAPHDNLILKVYDDIVIPENEKRKYRGLELSNKLKVLLISDPETDKSAAALHVQIGFMSDPRDIPGLAHFCEHMLFLGTKKYPLENEFTKFLKEHCGISNAYTAPDCTCYYFDIGETKSLKDALDRFAQFFLNPLFTESATEREVNSVHSEHEKNLQMDTWRMEQLEKSTCDPEHDFSKFGTGTIDTLWNIPKMKGINIREELLKFHEKFYSSNLMNLTVYGKESLEELADIVVPLFSEVVNKNLELPSWPNHPCDSRFVKLLGYILPVKELRELSIAFPIPDQTPYYHSNPAGYVSHLIGHEGPGSFLSELKRLGWVNTLEAGPGSTYKGFAFFHVNATLTEEGLEHFEDVITILFQYLLMVKQSGVQQWIFDEIKTLNALTFRYRDREKPISYVMHVSGKMCTYPVEDVISATSVLHEFKPDLVNEILNLLTPDNVRIAVAAKKFESICTETEPWYGTKYKVEPIGEDTLNKWRKVELNPNLKLPLPNEFIPTNVEIIPEDGMKSPFPILLKNTKMGQLWFKQDDQFELPKALMSVAIESPMAIIDPLHYNMNHLYLLLVKDALNEYVYAAEIAGLKWVMAVAKSGMNLCLNGYNEKLHVLLQKIMEKVVNLPIDKNKFEIWKAELHRNLKNFKAKQPHRHAIYYTSVLLNERGWTNEELLSCIDEVTFEGIQQFVPRLFSKVHYEALIYGNVNKKQACELIGIVESALKSVGSKHMMPSQLQRNREYQLEDGSHYVYEAINEVHNISAVESYYQCGVQGTPLNVMVELLLDVLSEPCYSYLRTQEQLGYIVSSECRRSHGAVGLTIVVQSEKPPSYIDSKIEAFVQHFEKHLEELSQKEFKNHIESLSASRLEKPKTMTQLCSKYWSEIMSKQYNFDRDHIEVMCLKSISKEDLLFFFKEMIACDAPRRKKLSVHVIPSNRIIVGDELEGQYPYIPEQVASCDGLIPPPPAFRPPVKIENITNFKDSLGLYPLVPPFIQIPSPFVSIPEKAKL